MAKANLDELDYKILSILSKNAKTPYLEIARMCNVSGAAIHQHIQQLTQTGVIKGSEFILSPVKVGFNTCAFIGVMLNGESTPQEVIEEFKKVPEVVECHFTSGKYSLFMKVYAEDNVELLTLIQTKIQTIKGVSHTETLISLNEEFRRTIKL